MKIGIELECVFNKKILPLAIGGYHSGLRLDDFWETQLDSSVHRKDKFLEEAICELVTHKLLGSKKEMLQSLISLQSSFNILSSGEHQLDYL